MTKIIILDFNTGEAHIYTYDSAEFPEAEDFVNSEGFQSSNCQWLTSDSLTLTIH
ncbi:MAG TPA: hypothetical protein PKU82_09710 [Bacteroidia bacterium]|nr:hypothetical protein [Bacteroidia bacterium]HOZ91462.1 hypothetical protein [Bacteroidia bacterium]HRB52079.1 hypothetical protein [Bacteroidia bacterium]